MILSKMCPLSTDGTISILVLLSTAKQGDNALGGVRPSVCVFACLFVSALTAESFDLRP